MAAACTGTAAHLSFCKTWPHPWTPCAPPGRRRCWGWCFRLSPVHTGTYRRSSSASPRPERSPSARRSHRSSRRWGSPGTPEHWPGWSCYLKRGKKGRWAKENQWEDPQKWPAGWQSFCMLSLFKKAVNCAAKRPLAASLLRQQNIIKMRKLLHREVRSGVNDWRVCLENFVF